MRLRGDETRQVFRATWFSGTVGLVVLLGLLAMACMVGAWFAHGRGGWAFGALGGFFGCSAWLLLRPFRSALPLFTVDAAGMGGYLLKGQVIPWRDVANVAYVPGLRTNLLQIVLRDGAASGAATAGLFRRGLQRNVEFSMLRWSDRQRAVQAALQGFHTHAPDQAQAVVTERMQVTAAHDAVEARLQAITPQPWAVYAVIAVNVAVWVLNLRDGLSPMEPTAAELFAWGGNSATAVVRDGEVWRLLVATVLHGGVLHLAFNMVALWDAGLRVCRWFGNGQFLLIYFGAGLTGSALSLHFASQQFVSVGASGAVFGVLGALLVSVFQHRAGMSRAMAQQLLTGQGVFVVLMLVQGFGRTGIDNAAHVGGLVAGTALAWVLVEQIDGNASMALRRRQQVVALGLAALLVGCLTWAAQPGVDHRRSFQSQMLLDRLLPRMRAVEAALKQDTKAQSEGRMSEAQLIDALEQRHIPAYRAVDNELKTLPPDPSMPLLADIQAFYATVLEMMVLEVGQYRGTADATQASARLAELSRQMQAIGKRMAPTPP